MENPLLRNVASKASSRSEFSECTETWHEQPFLCKEPLMSHDQNDPRHSDLSRRRLLQGMGALPLMGMTGLSYGAPPATAAINTTKLAVTDTEVIVGQLHSATGTMAISKRARFKRNSWRLIRSTPWAACWAARSR